MWHEGEASPAEVRLSRRPSEYLEFEKISSSNNLNDDSISDNNSDNNSNNNNNNNNDLPSTTGTKSSTTNQSNDINNINSDSGIISHTPFLYPKVKKINFTKKTSSPSITPPLESSPPGDGLDEYDPYNQGVYQHHHHPPSLSKLFFSYKF